MAKKMFTTIYGRNLVGELKNIVQRPYLVVTMEDLWRNSKMSSTMTASYTL